MSNFLIIEDNEMNGDMLSQTKTKRVTHRYSARWRRRMGYDARTPWSAARRYGFLNNAGVCERLYGKI